MNLRRKFFRKETKSTFKLLRKSFEQHSEDLLSELQEKHKDTLKWFSKKGVGLDKVVKTGSKGTLAALAAGFVMLSSGFAPKIDQTNTRITTNLDISQIVESIKSRQAFENNFVEVFRNNLPKNSRHLSNVEADSIAALISDISGIKVKAELDGNRLNTNYGKIGLEQHLPRYPGDNIRDHFEQETNSRYFKSGMTKNRGSFGYFSSDKASLTVGAIEKEKYYVVVQTFAIEGWGKKKNLQNWYKHRKVVVINTENGRAAVGVIADSGPAFWTGKSFGGSPELIDQLEMYQGSRKAKVLMFFVDDPNNEVKLGPI